MASSILLIVSGFISTSTAILLIESGLKKGIYSYPRLVEEAFGKPGKILSDIMITMA